MFRKVGMIGKPGDPRVAETLGELASFLADLPAQVLLDAETAEAFPDLSLRPARRAELASHCELVIIVGGDGTFLHAARSLVEHEVRLLGINLGRLGFLTDVMPNEVRARVEEVFSGRYQEEKRFLLHGSIERGGRRVIEAIALNDIVAHKQNVARLVEFETRVNGRVVNNQRADGLIVSTPTGSTAYALSGGGPILYPTLDAIVLVPICPHTLSHRPIVVGGDSRIEIVMQAGDPALVTCDGQSAVHLEANDRICIEKYARQLNLIHPPDHDYYATLRAKLHWSRAP